MKNITAEPAQLRANREEKQGIQTINSFFLLDNKKNAVHNIVVNDILVYLQEHEITRNRIKGIPLIHDILG